ncbi:MAG: hypothetical protein IT410_03460 [Candidatus Doudnabacteria bacterium]|nr:hypothetical protein [Candidatus Doudnabacteria bacterium]
MFYNREQKGYFVVTMLTIVVLIVVTFWRPTGLRFGNDNVDRSVQSVQEERDQYSEYLASLQADSAASKELLKEIVTEDAVRAEVELLLQTDQDIPTPDIPTSTLSVTEQTGTQPLTDYFTKTFGATLAHNEQVNQSVQSLFTPDTSTQLVQSLRARNDSLVKDLRGIAVPKEALAYHKSQILAFEHYGNILEAAEDFSRSSSSVAWSSVYRNYSIINNEIDTANVQFGALNNKYKFSEAISNHFALTSASSPFVHSADAIFGLGDFTIVVGDIPQEIWQAIREALARSFARFAITMLDKVVQSVEENFAITSQLYYSEALGQLYTKEYLAKYVQDPLDQELIKRFLPQYFCLPSNREELTSIFTQKAKDYLGYDPANLDPSDPDFYLKLAKSGDFLASPDGQELYYRDLASQAGSAASSAATKEVLSPGLKSPRDLVNNQIQRTMASIFNTEAAAINGSIQLGTNNVETIVGQLVASVIENLLNKFVFSGAVVQEQSACIGIPLTKPVIPSQPTDYEYTPPSQNPEDYLPPVPDNPVEATTGFR